MYPLNVLPQDTTTSCIPAEASAKSLICAPVLVGGVETPRLSPTTQLCEVNVAIAKAGKSNKYYLHTKDNWGNVRASASALPIGGYLDTAPPTALTFYHHPSVAGVYEVLFAPLQSGTNKRLYVTINNNYLDQVPLVNVEPGDPSPTNSLLEGSGLQGAESGTVGSFTVTLRDTNNNPTQISDGQDVSVSRADFYCQDLGMGVFQCSYYLTQAKT